MKIYLERIKYNFRKHLHPFKVLYVFVKLPFIKKSHLFNVIGKSQWNDDLFLTANYMNFLNEGSFNLNFNLALGGTPNNLRDNFLSIKYRAHIADWCANQVDDIEGDFVELGVWYGILSKTILLNNNLRNRKFYLIDPWANELNERYKDDIYKEVVSRFEGFSNVALIRGYAPEAIKNISSYKIAFLMIDMNSVNPEIESLKLLWPLVSTGGIIYFDDYGHLNCEGLRNEINLFFEDKKERILIFPSGNAIVMKI
jgi:O-methyltransferase